MGFFPGSTMAGSAARDRLIINFHGIGEPWGGVPHDERPYWCSTRLWPDLLEVLASLEGRTGVPLELTLDDGNASDIEVAVPGLVSQGLSATFFICAGRLNKRRYLSKEQVREIHAAGMRIGSHGWAHRDLRELSDADLDLEVHGAREELAITVGQEVDAFAIPFGSYDRRVLRRLTGWRNIYTSDPGRARPASRIIPRHSYVKGWTTETPLTLAVRKESIMGQGRRLLIGTVKRLR